MDNKAFQELFSKFKEAYPKRKVAELQNQAVKVWNVIKKDANCEDNFNEKMIELSNIIKMKKSRLLSFWSSQPCQKEKSSTLSAHSTARQPVLPMIPIENLPTTSDSHQDLSFDQSKSNNVRTHKTPVQETLENKMNILRQDIIGLNMRKEVNLLSDDQIIELKTKKTELMQAEKKMKVLKRSQERSANYRKSLKRRLTEIIENNPEVKSKLKLRKHAGQPNKSETEQSELLKTIIDIATYGSGSDEKRRTELIRSVKTLDELTDILKEDYGFDISRSGVYLRLLPKRSDSREGKRHINTVPVKLIRSQNTAHKNHIDSKFATASINYLEEISSILGPNQVFSISQDDKARIPIGITAAKAQTPLLMHMEYRVTLPDHDWVVAPSHKLIPSVYAGITIKQNEIGNRAAVTYSGPTYIAIRSAKHSSSTAYSHVLDFERLLQLTEFQTIVKTNTMNEEVTIKPVGIITVDGGPDENPRYMKVITSAIHHFVKHDLDALYITSNAPGRSAYNRVERRMAPLSRELAGVILPYDHFGTHLDTQGKTIDKGKEKKNFTFAGKTLGEIWSEMTIDEFPVVSEYIHPEKSEIDESTLIKKSIIWQNNHVRSSQYFLQIVKCTDNHCCTPFRSSLLTILPSRFMPPPIPIAQNSNNLTISKDSSYPSIFISLVLHTTLYNETFGYYKQVPYDISCPPIQEEIPKRICKKCGVYFAPFTYLKAHQKIHDATNIIPKIRPVRITARRVKELLAVMSEEQEKEDVEWIDEEDVDNVNIPQFETKENDAIVSLNSLMSSPWQ